MPIFSVAVIVHVRLRESQSQAESLQVGSQPGAISFPIILAAINATQAPHIYGRHKRNVARIASLQQLFEASRTSLEQVAII